MTKNYPVNFLKVQNTCNRAVLLLIAFFAFTMNSFARGPLLSDKGLAGRDATPPVITYTPLSGTCATTGQTLIATITDAADGVPTSGGGLPVLYWKINSGAYTPVTAQSLGSNQYKFVFGAGTFPGNLISYYIVAQDNAGNTIAQPSAGAAGYSTNPPAAATPPTSPDFYVIQTTLATGTYNVGAGQTYVTITDAVNAYNNSCLNGPVTFLLMDAAGYSTSETFPIIIGNAQASSTNTLTIKPGTGVNTSISGSPSDAIFKLNGADYVTIDGSNSAAATRNLSITNNSTSLTSAVIWVGSASASNGATNNTIKNCTITGNAGTTTYAGIVSSSGITAGVAAEAANTGNSYINNAISTCYYGMIMIGPAAGESNNTISTNTIGSTQASKKLGYRGILVSNETNVTVNNNMVAGIASTFGLGSDTDPTGGIIVSGAISGGNIYSNNINDVKNTNVGGWPTYGISLQSTSAAAGIKIYDNFIYNIIGNGNTTTPGYNGIGIGLLTGGGYGIFFNSVHLYTAETVAGISSCLFIGSQITGTASVDVRDNIFSNRRPTGTNYAVYCSVPNIIFSNINYNDYYSIGQVGFLGSARATISAWQTATGFDGNSTTVNPTFVQAATAPIDLHLQPISALNDQGLTISGITTDIDGTTRSATPDIGADEFTPPNCTGNSGGTVTSDFITVCTSGSVILTSTGFSYGVGITYQWQKSSDNVTWSDISGENNPTSANPAVITANTWYRLKVTCSLIGGTPGYSNSLMITVYNPSVSGHTDGSRCGPGSVSLSATGSAGTAMQWYTAATGGAPVFTGNPFLTPSLSVTTPYYVESTFLGSSGTVGPVTPAAEGGTISNQLTSWDVTFNVIQATKLLTIDVYPAAAGEYSVIDIYNSAGVVIASVPYTTIVAGGATVQTVTMNVSLPIGNGYYMYATNGLPPSGLTRNITNASYPYNSTDIVIVGNGFDNNFYMCYYNWRFSNGCSSNPRTVVTATIGASAAVNLTYNSSICSGQSTTITASSSDPSYNYTWMPGSIPGASITVSPTTTTTYTYTAVDGPCNNTGSAIVTVKPVPTNVVISPGPTVTKCGSAPATLITATGGDIIGVPVLTEGFNAAGIPAGWTSSTAGSTTNPAACAWTLRPNNYNYGGNTFRSNDLSQFYLSNSGANTGTTNTTLTSPAFSLVGFNSASLGFWHYFGSSADLTDSIAVEISQNATSWVPVYSAHTSRGLSTINWSNQVVSLNAYAGLATNYIRFRYYGTYDYQWAIDNLSITGGNTGTPINWTPIAGLFTDAAAMNAYTGTPSATVYAKPSTTTTYTATANPTNGCPKSDTVKVILRPISGTISSDVPSVCPGGPAHISIAFTGTGPWSVTYSDGILPPVTINNISTSPYTFTVNPAVSTTYTLTAVNDAFCSASPSDLLPLPSHSITVGVTATALSTWSGLIDNNWMNPLNWCGGVPTTTKDVVIPSGPTIFPVITNALPVGRDITIVNGASITINPGATLSFMGNCVNNGTLTVNGSLVLNGTTTQSFPGGTTGIIASLNNIEVNNAAGATINRPITIIGTLIPTAGAITLNNAVVTLHSDLSGTARVSALGATASFIYTGGQFSVERFVSTKVLGVARPAWRFLAAPIGGTQTISQAWQEGQAPGSYTSNGYGMQIVGAGGTSLGFDLANSIPSLKTYDTISKAWVGVPNTNTKLISSPFGYMAFIRGDRGSNTFGSNSPTTLREAGPIKTGPVGPIGTAFSNGFISVGNPYPSAIDFSTTTRVGLQNTYYVWDPKLGTYGGYQTFTGSSSPTPGGGSYAGGNKFIESGQAFFVVATAGAGPHSISFAESNKVAGSYQVQRDAVNTKQLRTQFSSLAGSEPNLIDGTLIEFDDSYSNETDDLDAPKLSNFGENISINNQGKLLSVERHAGIVNSDTIFYQFGQLRQQQYRLEFIATDLAADGLTAFLRDNYLQTTTNLVLDNSNIIDFTVDANPASSAADRFYVFFRQAVVVPVTFTSIKAYPQDKDIIVLWKVENEMNIDHYEVEHSVDGLRFSEIGKQTATGSVSNISLQYSLTDFSPVPGDNFYRVKSIGKDNQSRYTEIVRVRMEDIDGGFAIYPNPVTNKRIGINFIRQAAGIYEIKLFSTGGQLVTSQNLNFTGGTQRLEVAVSSSLADGVYNLEILMPGKIKRKEKLYKVVIE